jgi:hypothetical protein
LKNYLYSELREKQSHNVPQSSSSVLLVSVIGSVLKMKELVAKEDVDSEGSQHLKIVRLYQKFEKLVSHIWVANRESSKLTKVAFVV